MKKILITFILTLSFFNVYAKSKDNLIVQDMKKIGVHSCLNKIKSFSNYVIGNGLYSYNYWYNSKKPNKDTVTLIIARHYSDGTTFTHAVFAPTSSGHCSHSYVTIFTLNESCAKYASGDTGSMSYKDQLDSRVAHYITKDNNMDIYTKSIADGNQCQVIHSQSFTSA